MGQVASQIDDLDDLDCQAVLNYDLTLHGVCSKIKIGGIKNIVVVVGAGISTSAGIPDFRSEGTGIYNNLQEYNLPTPESMFDIKYFNENPKPFYTFAKELLPGCYYPTLAHYFLKLLSNHNILQKVYTQNIDTLERLAKIPENKIYECHGNFSTAHCSKCNLECDPAILVDAINSNNVLRCLNYPECDGYIKPGIIFYGEQLKSGFQLISATDMMAADLLIVMGTSLSVDPCANLPYQVDMYCPRLLINGENIEPFITTTVNNKSKNYRDVTCIGNIDSIIVDFAKEMGWEKELYKIQSRSINELDSQYHPERLFRPFHTFVNVLKSFSPFSPRADEDEEKEKKNKIQLKESDVEIEEVTSKKRPKSETSLSDISYVGNILDNLYDGMEIDDYDDDNGMYGFNNEIAKNNIPYVIPTTFF